MKLSINMLRAKFLLPAAGFRETYPEKGEYCDISGENWKCLEMEYDEKYFNN